MNLLIELKPIGEFDMAISEVYATNGDTSVEKPAGVSQVYVTNMPEGGSGGVTSVNGQTGDVTLSIPTVDQTYSSTSTNAQSGAAVAEAVGSITLSSLNTAGITDVQQVNALPAEPVATVLYLIPES